MLHVLHLRPELIAAGTALLIAWLVSSLLHRSGRSSWPRPEGIDLLQRLAETHWRSGLLLLCGGFCLAASLAKFSQLHALELNAEDFWLFEDMLAQMMDGGFFITRYAPQAIGWVQHGAVHPMLSWSIALPLAWIVGPVSAALLFGPLVFAGAGAMLAVIAKPRWGALGALAVAAAFLSSNLVGKILMYDVHPEAANPLFVFAWAWAAGWGDGKTRPAALLLSTAFLMGIKEDSFVVLPPLIAATALFRPEHSKRKWLAASAFFSLAVAAFQFRAVHQWSSGAWGPLTWHGAPVALPRGAELMRGRHWDTPSSALEILGEIISQRGGVTGVANGFVRFLFSRPWLSLLILAPWVVLQPAFWVSTLPLAAVYSLLDDPGKFINYYSAPILGPFWLAAISSRSRKPSHLLWLLSASLVLGGGGLDFYRQNQLIRQSQDEVRDLISCLPAQGSGTVSSRWLGLVPPDKVFSDRVPPGPLETVDFYLFSTRLSSYEMPPAIAESLLDRLKGDAHWTRIGKGCQPVGERDGSVTILFVHR